MSLHLEDGTSANISGLPKLSGSVVILISVLYLFNEPLEHALVINILKCAG